MAAHNSDNKNTKDKYIIRHWGGENPYNTNTMYIIEDTLSKKELIGILLAEDCFLNDDWPPVAIDIKKNGKKLSNYDLLKYDKKCDGYCITCYDICYLDDKIVLYLDDIEYIHGFRRGLRYLGKCDKWKTTSYNNDTKQNEQINEGIISITKNGQEIDYKSVFPDWTEVDSIESYKVDPKLKGKEMPYDYDKDYDCDD